MQVVDLDTEWPPRVIGDTVRLTPVADIMAFSVGSRAPGSRRPLVMSSVICVTSCWVRPRGADSGRNAEICSEALSDKLDTRDLSGHRMT